MKRFSNRMLSVMLIVMMAVMFMTATFADAYYVKQQWARISATCGETITTGQAVTLLDADGYAYKADANEATLRPAVGVAGKGCTSGGTVEIIVQGIFSGWTGLTESAPGFLSETAGAITQVAPAYSQQIGAAISATDYYVNCQNYFDTSSLTALGADVTITGATPSLTIGDTGDEDTYLIFDGQATDDFYIAFDTADDDLNIGYGGATEAAAGTQTAIEITDSATPAVTIPNAFAANGTSALGDAVTDSITVTGALQGATPLVLDGATDNANELTITMGADPGADYTLTIPATSSSAVMISALTTNDVDVANSVWGVSNGLAFGGATGANGFETTLTPSDVTADKTITLPDATGTVALTQGVGSYRANETTAATDVLTVDDCGKTIFLSHATEFATTLPAAAAGCYFKFIVANAPETASYTVGTNASANVIHGQVASAEDAAGSVVTTAASDTITFVDAKAIVGDYVEVISDGTNWYVSGMCNVQDGITTTQAT